MENLEEMKLNANDEELTVAEKVFGRKIEDDEIVEVRFGDLKEIAKNSVEETIKMLNEYGLIDIESWKALEEKRLSLN